jgi:hypothetical protein
MADLLCLDYINSLPQPFVARFYGGSEWPLHDIDVETGLLRIDVCGKLDVKHIGEVREFVDAEGRTHDADDFYTAEPDAEVWLRDLDNTGSMHPCTPQCPGAIRYVRADDTSGARKFNREMGRGL